MIELHIGGVCAAIELVDDRNADYTNLDVLSLLADNSWNGGIVLSEFAAKWPDLESVVGLRRRTVLRSAKGTAATSSGIPTTPLRGWRRNWLPEVRGSKQVRSS